MKCRIALSLLLVAFLALVGLSPAQQSASLQESATLEEILGWMQRTLTYGQGDWHQDTLRLVQYDGCSVTLKETTKATDIFMRFDLSDLNPESMKVKVGGSPLDTKIEIATRGSAKVHHSAAMKEEQGKQIVYDEDFLFFVMGYSSTGYPQRFARAIKHAIELCNS